MLPLRFFILDVGKILRRTLPLGIENQTLIVLCLGENACPRLE